jgi:hypothetical protein
MQFWWAPKNTPQSRVEYLGDVLEKAMQTDSVQQRMAQIQSDPVVVRGAAMLEAVEERRAAISSVDLRKTQALPNVPAFVIPLVVVMSVVVFLKSRHQLPSPAEEVPAARNDLASWCLLATVAYLVVLSSSFVDFRFVTFVYVLTVGGVLTGWRPRRLAALTAVAAVMSLGVHFLFTHVFDLVLP